MLKKIRLENFRGFENFTVHLRRKNVLVGKNNAGKSSIVESLRIISLIAGRASNLRFGPISDTVEYDIQEYGVSPSLQGSDIDLSFVCHKYRDSPAKITATFESKETITIYLFSENYIFAVLRKSSGFPVTGQSEARKLKLNSVKALPQVGPVQEKERIITDRRVKDNLYTSLAPSHFRNQINYLQKYKSRFEELVSESWSGVKIENLTHEQEPGTKPSLSLMIRDGGFVAEISAMGHGLQVWLQILWFIARIEHNDTVIIDEPDVYLHADLQRKLVRYLMNFENQIILTSHSAEIISEMDPAQIVIIDKAFKSSKFAESLPSVQAVLDNVGTVQNVYYLRISAAKRIVFVEGKDIGILSKLQNKIQKTPEWSLASIPNVQVGGWDGWKYVLGPARVLGGDSQSSVTVYAIFDRDFHLPAEIKERYEEAVREGVNLHIWSHKEIENFLIVPSCIYRIGARDTRASNEFDQNDISNLVSKVLDDLQEDVEDKLTSSVWLQCRKHGKDIQWCMNEARKMLRPHWSDPEFRKKVVPGKVAISKISEQTQNVYGFSVSVHKILKEIRRDEIDDEVCNVIYSIEQLDTFVGCGGYPVSNP